MMQQALRLGLLAAVLWMSPAPAESLLPTQGDAVVVRLQELPSEARETLQHIRQGGPFPYARGVSCAGRCPSVITRRIITDISTGFRSRNEPLGATVA